MWSRIRVIIRKELLVTFRDPRMRLLLFFPPIIQLIVFGYAVNLDVELSRLGWLDADGTVESRELAAEFEGSPHFEITRRVTSPQEIDALLDRGEVIAVVRVLPGFGRRLAEGKPAPVQVLIDGSDSNNASIAGGYISRAVARYSARRADHSRRRTPVLSIRGRIWFNEDLRSQNFFVPGVIVNIVGLVTVMLTAMAVVREKEIGTLEQLTVTPIRPVELMLGKTLPFAAVGMVQMVLITAAARLIFQVPFRGQGPLLLLASLLFVLTTLGAGLLLSTVSGTQQQAMMGSFFFFLPAFLLSGFAFPIRNMPPAVQLLTYLNPMRYFLEIVRGLFLKGVGIEVIWPQLAALLLIALVTVTASVLRFRKRVD